MRSYGSHSCQFRTFVMNSSRKIEISKASLVSLKAELSRKQDEVNKAKAQGAYIHPVPRPKKQTIWTKQNAGVSKRDEKDLEQEQEDEDVLKKSRAALEAKSKLYNKLSHDASGHDNQFLVDFEQKANEVEEEETFPEEYDDPSDSEDEWVDYEDCLGRTRRCLRKDLVHIKEKDAELFKSLGGGDVEEKEAEAETAAPELQSGDMRREALRQKWEQQEEELRKKSDIHYQDVLFDEARSHGVGYYGFSQDEAVRRSQQDSLQKLRQETKREQEATKDVKERRRIQLEARLKAARRRQRERLGLPPEEEEEQKKEEEAEVIEEPEQEESKAPEEPKPTRKSAPVRPWDIGKEGVKEVMSQEEWVKKKRTDRPQEFAPPSTYQPDFTPTLEQEETRPKPTLFFSSKKPASSTFQPTPIEDEIGPPLSYSTKHSKIPLHKLEQDSPSCSTSRGQGAEVPPPPTFDYYGPSSTASKRKATAGSDLESSISAGLKFLRQQAEDRERKKNKGLLDIV